MKQVAKFSVAATVMMTIAFVHPSFAQNSLTAAEQKDGWQLLYDGKTTAGWHSYGKTTAGASWSASDGTLHLDASKKSKYQSESGGDLTTDQSFENFDLKLEWKISKAGNSGVIFDINEDPKYEDSWNTGLEMQVLDNNGHSDGKIKKHRAGDLYDLISSSSEPVKPVGQWNQVEIRLDHGKLDLYLNNVKVVSTTLWTPEWKALVANSKFKDMPGFSASKEGKIALQDHGNDVWYRNIKIRKL